jgi:hypothetical protein
MNRKTREKIAKKLLFIAKNILAEEDDKCGEKGCIRQVGGEWKVMSGKTGKYWPNSYPSKKDAEDALKAWHASRFKGASRNLTEEQKDKLYDKTQKIVDKLSRKFRGIDGIQVLSDWSGDDDDLEHLHLGDAAEGGEIDGLPAAAYWNQDYEERVYVMKVHKKLRKELQKYGYYPEWHDSGTLLAYK